MFRKALTKGKAARRISPCLRPGAAGEGRGDRGQRAAGGNWTGCVQSGAKSSALPG